jgi:hypothetical protein
MTDGHRQGGDPCMPSNMIFYWYIHNKDNILMDQAFRYGHCILGWMCCVYLKGLSGEI